MDSNQMNQENQNQNTQANTSTTDTVYTDSFTDAGQDWREIPYPQNEAPRQTYYNYQGQTPLTDTKDGLCVASLVLGIVGFFLNPMYICSILAIIFGAVGMKGNGPKLTFAKAGLALGIGSLAVQFFLDVLISVCTFGAGIFSFCC